MIKLKKIFTKTIKPIFPFNFDGTVYVPHHFPTPDFEWKHKEKKIDWLEKEIRL